MGAPATGMARIQNVRTTEDAMKYLRLRHPKFFKDVRNQKMAAVIIKRMGSELAPLDSVQRAGALAAIMSLMYDMARAGIESSSLSCSRGVDMTDIFLEEHFK